MCDEGSIVSEEKVAQHYFANFGFCLKAFRVEELPVKSSMQHDAFISWPQSMFQKDRKEDVEECWSQHTVLFCTTFVAECLRHAPIILYSAL